MSGKEEFDRLYKQVKEFSNFIFSRKKYKHVFLRPFIPTTQKAEMIKEIIDKAEFDPKVSRLIILLAEKERMDILPGLAAALPDLWNESQGVVTYNVASAVSLTEDQKKKLHKKLEEMEGAPVYLKYHIDSDLIGGISLSKDNTIYDLSIRGSLSRMKEKITEG